MDTSVDVDTSRQPGTWQSPEVILPILFVVGVLMLLLVIGTLAVVLKKHHLANKRMPMGLPDGSMRALIALLILLLFLIITVFIFRELRHPAQPRLLQQLTQAQVDAIPQDTQLSRIRNGGPETAPLFDVTVLQQVDEFVKTYAVQLLATVSTLVVAVSAFYFGTSSTTTAFAAANRGTVAAGVQQEKILKQIETMEKNSGKAGLQPEQASVQTGNSKTKLVRKTAPVALRGAGLMARSRFPIQRLP